MRELFQKRPNRKGYLIIAAVLSAVLITGGCAGIREGQAEESRQTEIPAESKDETETIPEDEAGRLAAEWAEGMRMRDPVIWYERMTVEKQEEFAAYLSGQGIPLKAGAIGVSSPYVAGYAVLPEPENNRAWIVYSWKTSDGWEERTAERLTFCREDQEWKVCGYGNEYNGGEQISQKTDSLEQFLLFYANDLGLPNVMELREDTLERCRTEKGIQLEDPVQAAEYFLKLSGSRVTEQKEARAGENSAGTWLTYTFQDDSQIRIQMSGYQNNVPVDWELEDGTNTRTARDLAAQWARGVQYKDGHLLYPIMTDAMQEQFIAGQKVFSGTGEKGGAWYWKIGGSSPSYWNFTLTEQEPGRKIAVTYDSYGGGILEERTEEELTFAKEGEKLKVTGSTSMKTKSGLRFPEGRTWNELQEAGYSNREIFALLYPSQLGLPGADPDRKADLEDYLQENESEGQGPYDWLKDPEQAVEEWFWPQKEEIVKISAVERDGDAVLVTAVFRQGGEEAVITMIRPEKADGTRYSFWIPEQFQWK